jgi:hypothetical protein
MVFKSLLIIIIIAILMEDGSSIKKTEEEKREDEELARVVNATLEAEEEKKRKEEEGEVKKKKKKEDGTKEKRTGDVTKDKEKKDVKNKDEACPPANSSCPIVQPCPPCKNCEACEDCPKCGPCPEVGPCKPCGPCPRCEEPEECPPLVCPPVQPCPVDDRNETTPSTCQCPGESMGMTVPVALAVGATTTLLLTGVAAVIGILLRYSSPLFSGLLFIFIVVLTWYLSSHYPETARDLGGRVVATLREAAIALGHRVMEAVQRHQEQVSVPIKPYLFLRMSSMFI